LAEIAKDNRMTIPQLLKFGFTKANLVSLDPSTMGSSLNEQVKAYMFQLDQHDVKHLVFHTAIQSYDWMWSVVDEARATNQAIISGKFDGELEARDELISASGVVTGKITAQFVDVKGEMIQR
jgi:hypothetical protein